jgi:transcription initiation factor IIF auxiliary subunit
MEKWPEWLKIFLAAFVPGLAVWLVQRGVTRNKSKIDFINSVLEARLRINELTSSKIEELEKETEQLKQDIRDMVKRSARNLDECMKYTQTIQEANMRLNKTFTEVTEELELYKQELQKLKEAMQPPEQET